MRKSWKGAEWDEADRKRDWVGVEQEIEGGREPGGVATAAASADEGGSLSGLLRLKFQSTPEGGVAFEAGRQGRLAWPELPLPVPVPVPVLPVTLPHPIPPSAYATVTGPNPNQHRIVSYRSFLPSSPCLPPSPALCAYFIQITAASLGFMWLYWPEQSGHSSQANKMYGKRQRERVGKRERQR